LKKGNNISPTQISTHFVESKISVPYLQDAVTLLSQINLVHAIQSYFLKIRLNNITPSTASSSSFCPSFRFCYQNLCACHLLLVVTYLKCVASLRHSSCSEITTYFLQHRRSVYVLWR